MLLKPLQLRRRRWTLVFSVPFTLLVAAAGIYSLVLTFSSDQPLKIVGACAAVASLCVAGTFGSSVLEAIVNGSPAVTIDQSGLRDCRGKISFIPWQQIDSVGIGDEGSKILINFSTGSSTSSAGAFKKVRRLIAGADHAVSLEGLSYNPRDLERALSLHHRQSISNAHVSIKTSGGV